MRKSNDRTRQVVALHLAVDYRLDVRKFWVNESGNFSVWFYDEAGKEDIMDGYFSWTDVSPKMKFKDLLDLLLEPEPKKLTQNGLQDRSKSFLNARISILTRQIGTV